MLLSETEVRVPHETKVTYRNRKRHVENVDPRTSVTIRDHGCDLVLFFEPDNLSGDAKLLEVRILPGSGKAFEPFQLMPRLPAYRNLAQAAMAHDGKNAQAAVRALRDVGKTRRGLSDDHFALIAEQYKALVAQGEPHPVKALAAMQAGKLDISTASRWIKEARKRGFLPEVDDAR